ncbi:Malformin synthetase mlfA [Dissostichus eleginoides]|uniref:Malformin synthetase mlfA n=1 Tax=Dissostichus eleginoides TaxID=100907 RepID=A0AAD9BWL4_DISEL|nr:Malformin synthetase mlfA [Dissostichus eleginoides]
MARVLRKGKLEDKFRFNIEGTVIMTIREKPFKSLGKVFDSSLRDTIPIQSTCTELDGWPKSVDKSGLPGKFKSWAFLQDSFCPPHLCISNLHCRNLREEDQQPPWEMAWAAQESEQYSSLWAEQQTANALSIIGGVI